MSDEPFTSALPPKEPIDAQFEPASPQPPPQRKGPGWASLGLACGFSTLLGGAIGIYGADLLRPEMSATSLREALARERARIDTLIAGQTRLETEVAERLASIEPPAITSVELTALLGELDAAARRLDEAVGASGAGNAFASLEERVRALEADPPPAPAAASPDLRPTPDAAAAIGDSDRATRDARRAEAALALSSIEAAARRGTGFEADYRALRAAAPGNPSVSRLGRFIGGVPTLQTLQAEFPVVRSAALSAATPAGSGRLSWLEAVLGDSVSVRPAGPPDQTSRALDAAARALEAGDLTTSVEALAALEAAPKQAVSGWTVRANQRITLETVLDEVRLGLIDGED